MEATVTWKPAGPESVSFKFDGVEEGDQVTGSGTARLRKDGKLTVRLSYDQGDTYNFTGERDTTMNKARTKPGKQPRAYEVAVGLTQKERKLIMDSTFIDPAVERKLEAKNVGGEVQPVLLTLAELEDLQGHVASAANHAERAATKAALDKLYEKLERVIDQQR